MKKVVLKVDLYDDKIKNKAMKALSRISGVESLSVNMNDQKFTIVGDIDPVMVVGKLRKFLHAQIVSVGPAKELKEEKEPAKKEEEEKKEKEPAKKEKDEEAAKDKFIMDSMLKLGDV